MSHTVHAQDTAGPKSFYAVQLCDYWENVATNLSVYGERILFTGDIVQTHVSGTPYYGNMLFQVNQETGTWALISLWGDGNACLVAAGIGFEPYSN
jgi:hypothetical protein